MTNCGIEILPDELRNELQKIAYGACFLGSGGGGGIETSFNYIDKYCKGGINKNLVITDLNTAQGSGIVVAYMGAPQKVGDVECPDAVCDGVKKFETDMKKKDPNFKGIDYIIPIEIGPVSMVAACLAAHRMGKAVLDVDGAGRAVPTLDLITYGTNAGISVNPTILCSENHHQITLEISKVIFDEKDDASEDTTTMESLARPVLCLPLFDQKAGLVMWYFDDVTKLKEDHACVPGTLTFCQELGDAIQSMQGKRGVLPDVKKLLLGKLSSDKSIYTDIKEICRGTLDSATTSTAGGFDGGVITIKGDSTIKDYSGHQYTIIFQNESLILWDSKSAEPLVMAPHLISYLIGDDNGRYVFTNGDIMDGDALKKDLRGKEIVIYSIAAPNALRTSKMLCNTMKVLNTLGYYGNYEPFWEKQTLSMR